MSTRSKDISEVPEADELPIEVREPDPLRILATPLHMKTSLACLTNDWTNWAGYTVPDICSSLERELAALTKGAAIADLSPMGKYLITGAEASRFLDHLLIVNVAALDKGEAVISPMCQSNGKVINIVTVGQIEDDAWWLTCDGRHMNWLVQSARGFDVVLKDCSDTHAGIMLSGPMVSSVLLDADLGDCTDIVLRGARRIVWDGIELTLLHRPGGSVPGLSVWCQARDAAIVWNRLMDGGEDHGLEAIGRVAQTSLRIDTGIPAAGHDFVSEPLALRSGRSRSAIELGFDGLIDPGKSVFNGRAALLEERAKGSRLRLATIAFPGPAPQAGAHLYAREGRGKRRKDVVVGLVTSVGLSFRGLGSRGLGFVVADRVRPGDDLEVINLQSKELLQVSQRQPCSAIDVAD